MKKSPKKLLLFGALTLFISVLFYVITLEIRTRAIRAYRSNPLGGRFTLPSEAIRFLPDRVVATKGELSLYADYDAAIDGVVDLYLINWTGTSIDIARQDRDLYVKLYRQSSDGSWERAQYHLGASCGNSYNVAAISPGTFYKFRAAFSSKKDAKPCPVRFQFANSRGLASNIGIGLVSDEDVEEASYDSMAFSTVKWPRKSDPVDGFVQVLSNGSSYDLNQRLMAWRMIRETLYGTYDRNSFSCPGYGRVIHARTATLKPSNKTKLNEVAMRVIHDGQPKERGFAAAVLAADPLINTEILQSLVHDKEEEVWKWAALGLINAGDRQHMVKSCETRSDDDAVDAIWMLGEFPSVRSSDEKLLWGRVAQSNPPAFACCYQIHYLREQDLSILPYRNRFIDYLKKEIESPKSVSFLEKDRLYFLVLLVASWNREQDMELLRSFRNYPYERIQELAKSHKNKSKE